MSFPCQPLWRGERGGGAGRMQAEIGPIVGDKEFARADRAESQDMQLGPGSGQFPSLSGLLPSDRAFRKGLPLMLQGQARVRLS